MVDAGASSRASLLVVAVLGFAAGGCSSSPPADAFQNKVFYQYDSLGNGVDARALETHYPPLDLGPTAPLPEYIGIGLMGGAIHMSRPRNWVIRAASGRAEHRFVEYVSPREYLVTIYELVDSPVDPWLDIMTRYEEQAGKAGADLLSQRVPMATWNAQGRGYVVRRPVAASKAPLVNYAHEYLIRSDRRIVLVQIVHHDENLEELETELRRVVDTLEVN
jgi:hypothetical protein